MKTGLSLWVYDVAMNRYLRLNLKEDLSEIRKAYAAFKYESNFPWKVIVLCDKNEDVVLSFCDSSLHQDMEKHNSFYARKYLEYLLTHEVKLGCFAVDDKVTFSNLILTLIKKVEVYNFECENIRKKKAKQNFKKAIQFLYEYACIHSEVEVFEKKDQHYQIFKKDLDPYRFINENWKTEMQELLSIFSDESQEAYLSAAWQAMQTTKKEFIRIEFDFNRKLTEIQNKLILQKQRIFL